jgi:hypothetical protein
MAGGRLRADAGVVAGRDRRGAAGKPRRHGVASSKPPSSIGTNPPAWNNRIPGRSRPCWLGQLILTIVPHAWNYLDLGDGGGTIAATVRNRINSAASRTTWAAARATWAA